MTITTAYDMETEQWRLYATNHGRTEVAGPRILRAPPHPDIQWRHDSESAAEKDAVKLRAYLEQVTPRAKKKSQARSAFEE